MDLERYIREIPDFPKPGVIFKDITPLLNDNGAYNYTLQQLISLVSNEQIDKVIGVESRGFFFGMLMAQELNAGFVPVRKPNKLPFTTISQSYDLEYGSDAVEIHADAIEKGDRVLIHDDVLATGGTAGAVCTLVEKLGGEIVQCNFLMELTFLKGREKLNGHPTASLLQY